MRGLNWHVAERNTSLSLIEQMLANRGVSDVSAFLNPTLDKLFLPNLIPNMQKAAARIATALRRKQRIVVFGDFDVDGVTATTTLYHSLKHFGNTPRLYIPHRIDEGYGLNNEAVAKLCREGADLIITVDCGITAVEPALIAKRAKVDMIITDHHEAKESLPEAFCVVHPRYNDSKYPNPDLCGAGVAFKLAWAIGQEMSGGNKVDSEYKELLSELLAFSSLGTIADVVPLHGENRSIAHFGLTKLPQSKFHGIQAFLKSARLEGANVDGYHVGFCLAPRLNAAGRMGHAFSALRMLTEADPAEAEIIARSLEKQNFERQATEKKIVEQAKADAQQFAKERDPCALVVGRPDWHPGVVGIVASRLVDEYYCPSIVLSITDGEAHGSCRSVEGFNLATALKECEHLLTKWGGHAMAAGVRLPAENVDPFRQALSCYVQANCPPELLKRKLEIDAVVNLADCTEELVNDIASLGPFGNGNRRPILALNDAVILDPKAMGKDGKHLTLTVAQGGQRRKCIAWNQGATAHLIPTNMRVDLAFEPQANEWQGRKSVELLARDIRPR